MLWIYGHYKYVYSYSGGGGGGIDFRRQILTYIEVRIWRIKTVPVFVDKLSHSVLYIEKALSSYFEGQQLLLSNV